MPGARGDGPEASEPSPSCYRPRPSNELVASAGRHPRLVWLLVPRANHLRLSRRPPNSCSVQPPARDPLRRNPGHRRCRPRPDRSERGAPPLGPPPAELCGRWRAHSARRAGRGRRVRGWPAGYRTCGGQTGPFGHIGRAAGTTYRIPVGGGGDARPGRTTVVRARAEECGSGGLRTVRSRRRRHRTRCRSLDRLTAWCLPLAAEGGRVLALKGESAAEEVAAHRESPSAGGPADGAAVRGASIRTTVVDRRWFGRPHRRASGFAPARREGLVGLSPRGSRLACGSGCARTRREESWRTTYRPYGRLAVAAIHR